jgi:hypothetical protein
MITSGTQMPCADFYDTVRDAVKEAIKAQLDYVDIHESIKEGIIESRKK